MTADELAPVVSTSVDRILEIKSDQDYTFKEFSPCCTHLSGQGSLYDIKTLDLVRLSKYEYKNHRRLI